MRGLIGALVVAAALGTGPATYTLRNEREPRDDAKSREEQEIERRKRLERSRARDDERQRERAAADERNRMLAAGLDPTNGNPLSRQQRRWQARKGPNVSGLSHTGGDRG